MNRTKEALIRLRWACRGITGFGFAASITGNALNAQHNVIAIGISVSAPVFLLLAFELVTRIPTRSDLRWWKSLWRPTATAGIALISAALSYRHQKVMIYNYSNHDGMAAALLPLAVDGLLIVASTSTMELNHRIDQLLAHEAGAAVRIAKPRDEDLSKPPRVKEPTAKERIAEIWAKAPTLPIKDIAAAAGASYNYAYSVVKELSRQEAELVSV